jgi:hypothetical protein
VRAGAVVAAALAASQATAHAEPRVAAAEPAKPVEPDPIADVESREANLESTAPRYGMMVAFSAGFGLLLGGDIGAGSGGMASFRLGHVATRRTIITFELTGTGALHKQGTNDSPVTDTNGGLFAGAQTYASPSTWFRIAAGPTVFNANVGGTGYYTKAGLGGLVGGGFDLARWGYLALDLEALAMASVTRGDGFKFQLGFGLGLAYY